MNIKLDEKLYIKRKTKHNRVFVTYWEKFQDSIIYRVLNNLQRSNGSHAIYILKLDLTNMNKYVPRNNLLLVVENVIYLLYSIYKLRSTKPTQLELGLEA